MCSRFNVERRLRLFYQFYKGTMILTLLAVPFNQIYERLYIQPKSDDAKSS